MLADDQCSPRRSSSHRGGQDQNYEFEGKLPSQDQGLKEDARNWFHWLWDELEVARNENRWLWEELQQARSEIYSEGSSSQKQERIQLANQAQNVIFVSARFF